MSDIQIKKEAALKKLQDGAEVKEIAGDLCLPFALVEEWEDSLTDGQKRDRTLALSMPDEIKKMKEDGNVLGYQLEKAAYNLTKEIDLYGSDPVMSKALLNSAQALAVLHKSFISETGNINIQNNSNELSIENLSVFKGFNKP